MRRCSLLLLVLALLLIAAPAIAQDAPPETPVVPIALSGPAAARSAEISGLAWHDDTLLLVLENPNAFADESRAGLFFALDRADILAYLEAKSPQPLEPRPVTVIAPDLRATIPGFDGFEAAVFVGDAVYLTAEVYPAQGDTYAVLVRGSAAPDLSAITLDLNSTIRLDAQTPRPNTSYEALTVFGEQLLAFYEVNGTGLNAEPRAQVIALATFTLAEPVPAPALPFRLTDTTEPDADGIFWAINYFFTGDSDLAADADPLAEQYGRGATHAQYPQVERLVALHVDETGAVVLADTPPIPLALPDDEARNWEGIVRLDQRGFLLVTDKYPQTILALVPVLRP